MTDEEKAAVAKGMDYSVARAIRKPAIVGAAIAGAAVAGPVGAAIAAGLVIFCPALFSGTKKK